ncbi:MAG: Holliday junction resolvase RuvX [Chthonomonadaceae bacterium]|nr:Holliday junction resolvase RuvX [Chthonomonadaceae bacterium]
MRVRIIMNAMARVMGLDVGEKTIGVALSDEAEVHAFPAETIWRRPGWRQDMRSVRDRAQAHQVRAIVVGMPLNMDGTRGAQAGKVEEFIRSLRNYVRVPIIVEDERLTSWEAEQRLLAGGYTQEKRKEMVHAVAASLILQAYLDRKRCESAGGPLK